MAANYDEAMRCVKLAAAAAREGESARSERLLAKASRMCPDLDVPAALRKFAAPATSNKKDENDSATTTTTTTTTTTDDNDAKLEPQREASAEMLEDVAEVQRARNDLYAVLGVGRDASAADLKRAYRKKVLALHPDKNIAPGAEDAFKAVARAWETLSDVERRRRYDVLGVTDDTPPPQVRRRRRAHHPHDNPFVHVHTMHGDIDMEEIFAAMFGAPPPRNRAHFQRARRQQQVQQDVSPIFAILWFVAVLGTFSFISFVMNALQQLLVG